MSRKAQLENGKRHSSIITVDLNSAKMKTALFNIAKNKGSTLTDFVRSTLYKLIDDAPAHMKTSRHSDDSEE